MAYAMFELAQKPQYQEKIREEVRAFERSAGPGHELAYNDLKHFRYARACIEVSPPEAGAPKNEADTGQAKCWLGHLKTV